jgi:hypothetical protein
VSGNVKVDGTGGVTTTNISGGADIEFASVGSMVFTSGSQYLAPPAGMITLTHPAGVVPQRSGATFNPQPVDNVVPLGSAVLPSCPVCGDNIVQVGEVCDKGPQAQGACCNSTCTAFLCATATPTPTATRTRTPTPTSTPGAPVATLTATPVPTLTATAAVTATRTPTLTTTAAITATLTATATVTVSATPTPLPSATATATVTPTAVPTSTATLTATPTVTATVTPSPVVTATATPSATATLTASAIVTSTVTPTPTATRSTTPSGTRTFTPSPSATITPSGPPSATPTPNANPLTAKAADKCQRAITKAGTTFKAKRLKSLDKCANGVLHCIQEKASDPTCLPKATVTCSGELIGTFASLQADFQDAVSSKCEGVGLTIVDLLDTDTLGFGNVQGACATLGSPLTDIAAVSACVLAQHECGAEQLFELQEPRAGEMIDLVRAQGGTFAPLTCLTDHGPGGATADPKTLGKAVEKCEAQMKASGTKFLVAQLKALTTCAAGVLTCDVTQQGDSGCLAKASSSCTKGLAKVGTEAGKVGPAIDKRCGASAINFDALRAPTGANLDALAGECAALGVPAINSIADYETCLIRQHTCHGEDLTLFEVPRAEELLGAITPPATLHSPFCPSAD